MIRYLEEQPSRIMALCLVLVAVEVWLGSFLMSKFYPERWMGEWFAFPTVFTGFTLTVSIIAGCIIWHHTAMKNLEDLKREETKHGNLAGLSDSTNC